MSDVMFCTEAEVSSLLLGYAKEIDNKSAIFVAFRKASRKSLKRVVTFVIQTKEGNEALVNKIVKESTNYDMQFRFDKSDINIQSGNLTVDYLYVDAIISPNLT